MSDGQIGEPLLPVIVDYGMGNLASVENAFKALGVRARVVHSAEDLEAAGAIILPGVGAFGDAMDRLRKSGLDRALTETVMRRKTPFLGICLGMQLIASTSEEGGNIPGLGWLDARVTRIQDSPDVQVPHVGWNDICCTAERVLLHKITDGSHFYFDHSYEMLCDADLVAAQTEYGGRHIVAAVEAKNIVAVQFHPEKSQNNGLRLFRNFLRFADATRSKGLC